MSIVAAPAPCVRLERNASSPEIANHLPRTTQPSSLAWTAFAHWSVSGAMQIATAKAKTDVKSIYSRTSTIADNVMRRAPPNMPAASA